MHRSAAARLLQRQVEDIEEELLQELAQAKGEQDRLCRRSPKPPSNSSTLALTAPLGLIQRTRRPECLSSQDTEEGANDEVAEGFLATASAVCRRRLSAHVDSVIPKS